LAWRGPCLETQSNRSLGAEYQQSPSFCPRFVKLRGTGALVGIMYGRWSLSISESLTLPRWTRMRRALNQAVELREGSEAAGGSVDDHSVWLANARPSSSLLQASGQPYNGGRSERSQIFQQRPGLDLGVCFSSSWRMVELIWCVYRGIMMVDALCNG
jgi:hypothetical protein